MKNIKHLMKMQRQLQEKMAKMQEDLANKTVEASSGGGMVTVVANGQQEIVEVKIKPEAVDPEDVEMLEDLVIAAVNSAMEKSKELGQEELGKITGSMGLNIPGMPF